MKTIPNMKIKLLIQRSQPNLFIQRSQAIHPKESSYSSWAWLVFSILYPISSILHFSSHPFGAYPFCPSNDSPLYQWSEWYSAPSWWPPSESSSGCTTSSDWRSNACTRESSGTGSECERRDCWWGSNSETRPKSSCILQREPVPHDPTQFSRYWVMWTYLSSKYGLHIFRLD